MEKKAKNPFVITVFCVNTLSMYVCVWCIRRMKFAVALVFVLHFHVTFVLIRSYSLRQREYAFEHFAIGTIRMRGVCEHQKYSTVTQSFYVVPFTTRAACRAIFFFLACFVVLIQKHVQTI